MADSNAVAEVEMDREARRENFNIFSTKGRKTVCCFCGLELLNIGLDQLADHIEQSFKIRFGGKLPILFLKDVECLAK